MNLKVVVSCLISALIFTSAVFAQNQDTLKADIYSKISDRRCPTMTLDKCNCPEAQLMKAYIDAFLETGASKEDIFYRVARKYSLKTITDGPTRALVEKRLEQETGGKYSRAVIEPSVLDFGKVSKKKGKISLVSKVYNKGSSDLVISNIRVSCGCVSASLKIGKDKSPYFGVAGALSGWQAKIAPGKYAALEVVLDLNHSSMGIGKQTREIFVSSNDPFEPETTVKAAIEVKE